MTVAVLGTAGSDSSALRSADDSADGEAAARSRQSFRLDRRAGVASDELGEARPASRYRSSEHLGVLVLVLSADGYTWEFVAIPGVVERAGSSVDNGGSGTC